MTCLWKFSFWKLATLFTQVSRVSPRAPGGTASGWISLLFCVHTGRFCDFLAGPLVWELSVPSRDSLGKSRALWWSSQWLECLCPSRSAEAGPGAHWWYCQ